MMDGLNLDPGLRQAYTKQTEQRFLAEANNARMLKSVKNKKPGPRKFKQFTFSGKLKAIGQIIRSSGSEIMSVIRTTSGPAKA
jgi:hypothetical protein